MGDIPDDAYRLQIQAERWQELVVKQQDIALRLRALMLEQRDLTDLWEAAGADWLVDRARQLEGSLGEISTTLLELELKAIDVITSAVNDATRQIRPE